VALCLSVAPTTAIGQQSGWAGSQLAGNDLDALAGCDLDGLAPGWLDMIWTGWPSGIWTRSGQAGSRMS